MTTAIRLSHVSKTYPRYASVPPSTLKETTLTGFRGRKHRRVHALDDVSVEVSAGRTVGLIGHNGAGKSTLLKLVAEVGRPDRGQIQVTGRVAALLELGAGFHPELTGRESALVAGVVAGLSRREVRNRMNDIAAFAEIEDFLDAPIRTYSTGMRARLAFSLAIAVEPDVLVVDEVLAVGDLAFQARCIERIRQLQRAGITILFVSHDPALVDELCDEVVWLRGGRVVGQGSPREVTERYRMAMSEETRRRTPAEVPETWTPAGQSLRIQDNRFGGQEATVTEVHVVDGWGVSCEQILSGTGVRLEIVTSVPTDIPCAQLGVTLTRSDGLLCLDTATLVAPAGAGGQHRLGLGIDRLDLTPGDYWFDVGLYDEHWSRTYDYHWRAYPLRIQGVRPGPSGVVLSPPMTWNIEPGDRRPVAVAAIPEAG